ncbi:MAG: phosphatidylglycerol lysyltransferase domain-containing protein [Pyrinomonadaceae bacterium]
MGISPNYNLARELVLEHGWNTTCFQIVNPGLKYWFGEDGDSVIAYVRSNGVRVVAGAPVCPKNTLKRVAEVFEGEAADSNESVCYFGAEGRLDAIYRNSSTHSRVSLGGQPVWHPARWGGIVESKGSLRAQFNRARNKGVTISEWGIEKATNNARLRECLEAWFTLKGLPPLHFVVEPETLGRLENRRIFVAEHDSRVAAFLILSPIPTRKGWLTEQFPHRPEAPNGTVELMMDQAIRKLGEEGYEYVTLGISPLSKRAELERFDNPAWLRLMLAWMRKHGQRFYNFDGLDQFKSKLLPEYWEPVYAISNEPRFSGRTMWAIASAFAENRPFSVFGRGLFRAFRTEMGNVGNWFKRRF